MTQKIGDKELTVETHDVEWGVECTLAGEPFIFEADDEAEARMYRAMMGGKLVVREVYVTSWADAPND